MKTHTDDYIAEEETRTREPIELYHMWRVAQTQTGGETMLDEHWSYTSYTDEISFGGRVYTPATLKRSSVVYDSQFEITNMNITAAHVMDPVLKYVAINPVDIIWIQVMKYYEGVSPEEASTIFVGQIKTVSFQGIVATINCVGFEHFLSQAIPKFRFQVSCNNDVYDSLCTLDIDNYKFVATITGISNEGMVVTADELDDQDDHYYTRGYIRWRDEFTNTESGYGRDHFRMIVHHIGTSATIRFKFNDYLAVGATVYLYAGCDKQLGTCKTKFNNILNFFGHPWIPIDNPATWTP